jgi:hypothetical protein
LRRLVFVTDLKAQGFDPGLFAQVFGEGDHGLAQVLPGEMARADKAHLAVRVVREIPD